MHPDEFAGSAMPAEYVREDRAWIDGQLSTLPPHIREKIAGEYSRVYQAAFDAEPVSFRQENAGRKAANKRLRKFCKRYSPSVRGYTVRPPKAA